MNTSINHSSDLEDLALELGASVRNEDGSVFNAAKRSGVQRMRKTAPAQEPAAPQPAPPPQLSQPDISAVLKELMTSMQPQAPVVHNPPAQVVIQPAARCSWEFTFTRNRDGSIQSITANPKE